MSPGDQPQPGLARVLDALERAVCAPRPSGKGWQARCPAHDDRLASLSIGGGNDGRVLLHCHAGCTVELILKALGLEMRDLFPERSGTGPASRIEYVYRDEGGAPLFRVVRGNGKRFHQERHEDGVWKARLKDVRRVPYRLPEALAAIEHGEMLCVAEGEKDVESLVLLGLAATCNAGGAGKWRNEYAELLRGARRVCVLADNDAPGRKHAEQVAASFHDAGVGHVAVVTFPELPDHGDVSDWLSQRAELSLEKKGKALLELIENAPWRDPGGKVAPHPLSEVGVNATDLGNAERLVARHGDHIRYVHAWASWVVWDSHRWTRDRSGEVTRLAIQTVRSIYAEAATLEGSAERKARAKHAAASESAGRIRAMIELAQSDACVAVLPEVFDCEATRYLFNVANGTLDVRSGELRPHLPGDYITKLAPVRFDPRSAGDQWHRFLERILPDPQVRAFLQRFVGSALTGDTADRRTVLAYGHGKNGKSTLVGVLHALLGDYAHAVPFDLLLEAVTRKDRRGAPRSDLMALAGVRLASAVEAPEGQRFDETLLKAFTGGGGDLITGRRLYEREDWSFVPEAKLLLAGNHRPEIRAGGQAIWDRICEVPFLVRIPESEQDQSLLGRLSETDQLAGILAWAFQGARDWWSIEIGDRLRPPDTVLRATEAYRVGEDPIGDFLADRCVLEAGAQATSAALWKAYQAWAVEAGEKGLLSRKKFASLLTEEHGCETATIGHQKTRGFRGIRVRNMFDDGAL